LFGVAFALVIIGATSPRYIFRIFGMSSASSSRPLDIYRTAPGFPIPLAHVHRLASWRISPWLRVAGYSIEATRLAMLVWAAATVLTVFLFAIQICRPLKGGRHSQR